VVVAARVAWTPSLGEPLAERLMHPLRTGGQARVALRDGEEVGFDHDAVRVGDAQLTLVLERAVHLGAQDPSEVWRDAAHLVERAFPARHAQPGLLFDLARETSEHALVGRVDDATRGAPVGCA